jgi:hypothetical protein
LVSDDQVENAPDDPRSVENARRGARSRRTNFVVAFKDATDARNSAAENGLLLADDQYRAKNVLAIAYFEGKTVAPTHSSNILRSSELV